jgi:hypothetical protein
MQSGEIQRHNYERPRLFAIRSFSIHADDPRPICGKRCIDTIGRAIPQHLSFQHLALSDSCSGIFRFNSRGSVWLFCNVEQLIALQIR